MRKGYTVLELLVVIAIMGLLLGVGYANYRGYAQSQGLAAASRALRSDLRLAQEQATGGQKPTGCTGTLLGYKFNVTSTTTYEVSASCSGGDVLVKSITVPAGMALTTPTTNPIIFKPLAQGTNINGFTIIGITQQSTNNYAALQISGSGNIEENFATPVPSGYTPPPNEQGGFTTYQPDHNTVGFWHMNENNGTSLADSSSASITASTTASVTTGKLGNGRSFGGYMRPGAGVSLGSGSNTVDFWMKWNGQGSNMMIFAWDNLYNFDLYTANCLGFNTNAGEIYGTTTAIPSGQWVYVAIVYGRSGVTSNKIYINGSSQSLHYCLGGSSNVLQATSNFWVGSYGGGWPFNGVIDEVRISNIERTATEIQGAYQYALSHN